MKKLKVIFCLVLPFLVQGCYTLNQVGAPTTENGLEITNSEKTASTKHFSQTKSVDHFVLGLISPEDGGVEQILSNVKHDNSGAKVVNVKMKYQQTFVDGLLSFLTAGIYTPFTLTVEGDVVK